MITRRDFLAQAGGSVTLALASLGCSRPKTRAGVLEAIVTDVVLPDLLALAVSSPALERALRELNAASEQDGPRLLARARSAHARALLDWQRSYAFRIGPAVDSNAFLRATFWPVRKAALGRLIDSPAAADAALVDSAGVDAKGMFALEQLLFDPEQNLLTGALAARRRKLALALARDVSSRAQGISQLLGDGRDFARRFAVGGQESLSRVVNQMVETVETVAVDRLARVLGPFERQRRASEFPGGPSGLSTRIPLQLLEATHELYAGARGTGLCTLVELANPAAEKRVAQAFAGALAALRGLAAPLEQVVTRDRARVQLAADRVRALELALKIDLSAALAVTLSIASGDGD